MKYFILLIAGVVFIFLFFPRTIPWIFRRFGRSVGDAGRAGTELLTGEEVQNSPLARYEVRAGELLSRKILAETAPSQRDELQETVAAIGRQLSQHAQRKEIPYRFTVLNSAEPNAFAVAGGSIFVTEALINLCGDDVGALACVLGHEIIHIDQRHALRNLASSTLLRGGVRLISFGRGAILSRVVGGMEQLMVSGYRQEQEFEADVLGSRLARLAGYEPHGLIRLLERLRQLNPDGRGPLAEVLSYFKSHPPTGARVANLHREFA